MVEERTRRAVAGRPHTAHVGPPGKPGGRRCAASGILNVVSGPVGDPVSGDLAVRGSLVLPGRELHWRFSRSSGPGGQGVNTTDSRVELWFDVAGSVALPEADRERLLARLGSRLVDGVVTVVASENRSQRRNRDTARDRLAALLRTALAPDPPPRRPTRPTRGAQRRRLDAKTRRGAVKRLRGRGRHSDDS